MAKSKSPDPKKLPDFEQSLAELEKTVHDLEDGSLGLEASLARYENGVKLLRHCHDLLSKAQRRIELLADVDEEGNATTRPLEEEPDDSLEQKARRRTRRRSASNKPNPLGDGGDTPENPDDVDGPAGLF